VKETILAALNQQINIEMSAFTTYLSMAAYFESEALPGFSAWMRHHAEEEMVHALKIYDFIHRRRGRVTLQALAAPETTWATPTAAFEDALHHEQLVTASINQLLDLAHQERDHATSSFLQWFVDEQVEEEEVVDAALQKIKRIGDYGPGLYMLDRELAQGSGDEAEDEGAEAS
jgi:ferritin